MIQSVWQNMQNLYNTCTLQLGLIFKMQVFLWSHSVYKLMFENLTYSFGASPANSFVWKCIVCITWLMRIVSSNIVHNWTMMCYCPDMLSNIICHVLFFLSRGPIHIFMNWIPGVLHIPKTSHPSFWNTWEELGYDCYILCLYKHFY